MTPKTSSLPPGQYLTLRLKADETQAQDAPLKISGVANDATVTDSFGTRIKLSQRALDGFMSNPVMLLNHDVHNPIGKFTSVEYRGNKLHVEGEIDPDARTNTGASVADLARRGILKAFSIRFDEATETRAKDHVQLDAEVLDEISIVTLPSNRASLFGLRSKGVMLHGAPELLDQEERQRVADLRTPDPTRAAGPLSLELLTSRLRKLVRDEEGDGNYYGGAYLVAVYDDVVVWTNYDDSRFYQRAYAVDTGGSVTLTGENQEVIPAWTVVGSGGERAQAPQVRATDAPARLHPDDLAEIVRQVRGSVPELLPTEPAPEGDPLPEIPVEEGLTQLRTVIQEAATAPAPVPTPEEVPLDAVRSAIRSAITST